MRRCDPKEEVVRTFGFAFQRNFELGSSSRCEWNSDGGCPLSPLSQVVSLLRLGTSHFWNELFAGVL